MSKSENEFLRLVKDREKLCGDCRENEDEPVFVDAAAQETIDDKILPREDSPSGWYHTHSRRARSAVWCAANSLFQEISKADPVNPSHYQGDYVMRIIEDFKLDFLSGTVVKYMLRAGNKPGDSDLQDLRKAAWYLNRKIQTREKEKV